MGTTWSIRVVYWTGTRSLLILESIRHQKSSRTRQWHSWFFLCTKEKLQTFHRQIKQQKKQSKWRKHWRIQPPQQYFTLSTKPKKSPHEVSQVIKYSIPSTNYSYPRVFNTYNNYPRVEKIKTSYLHYYPILNHEHSLQSPVVKNSSTQHPSTTY